MTTSPPTEAHSTERNKRWTELSALYVPNRQQWAELKQHVEWLYSQVKAAQVATERDKYLCKLLVEWSIRANDGEDHGSPAEHILRTLIKVADERRAPLADAGKQPCPEQHQVVTGCVYCKLESFGEDLSFTRMALASETKQYRAFQDAARKLEAAFDALTPDQVLLLPDALCDAMSEFEDAIPCRDCGASPCGCPNV